MQDEIEIKKVVKEKYGQIAKQSNSCCCSGQNKVDEYTILHDEYENIDGHFKDADLSLGCGVPTEYAGIKKGDTVVDLGSGAGNDVFVARAIAGETGKIIGVDMTEEMIEKANRNNTKLGYKNIEFKLGEIENIPIEDETVDVVISNCVLNLVPNKKKAFSEIYRILKNGGHFCVSDIVLKGELPEKIRKSAEMYIGCVSGAVQQEEYINVISDAGFTNIEIKSVRDTSLPDELLQDYLSKDEINNYKETGAGIFSITVVGYKK